MTIRRAKCKFHQDELGYLDPMQTEVSDASTTVEIDGKKIEIPPAFVRGTIDIEDYITAQAVAKRDYFSTWVSEPKPGGLSTDELQRMQRTICQYPSHSTLWRQPT